ncbi:MAG: hypothetical protein MUE60_11155 [Candidatus Eisenbacteria bacterium]|nr:hypothetical protein [Candidatus Eisenbacteria bacterium]
MLKRTLAIASLVGGLQSLSGAEHWERYAGLWGADVRALAEAPNGAICLGVGHHDVHGGPDGIGGGLYVSNDAGNSWERTPLQGPSVAGIAVSQNRIFVATFGEGVWHSDDVGGPWEPLNTGLDNMDARCIAAAGEALLLGTTSGFYFLDSSNTWQPAVTGGSTGGVWAMARSPWDPSTLIAATDSAVWKSTDGGGSWAASGQGMAQRAARCVAIGSNGRCWAGTFDYWNGYAHFYTSADSGATWSLAYAPGEFDAVWSVAISPEDPDVIMIGTGCLADWIARIFRTSDGGQEWEDVLSTPSLRSISIRTLLFLPDQRVLAGSESSGGVQLSVDDGITWAPALAGLEAVNVHAICLTGGDILVGKGRSSAMARGVQGGQTWIDMDPGFPSAFVRAIAVWPGNAERILTAAWNDAYLSSDGGERWASQNLGSFGTAVSISPADTSIAYYCGHRLYVTRDGCATWEGPDTTLGYGVTTVVADPRDGYHAFASASGYLFETHDAAATWDTAGTYDCTVISFHPVADRMVYLGTAADGVHASSDGGGTFEWVSANLADQSITALAVGPGDPGVIWAGTPTGVYKTLDGGDTWMPDSDGLQNRHVLSLDVDEAAWLIRVGTYAGGISWSRIDHQGAVWQPGSAEMLRLWVAPVPSRGLISVTPAFACTTAESPLDISLYSLGGRLIRQERFHAASPFVWDLGGIPSGAYTLRGTHAGRTAHALVVMTP